jgi:hypothetical protein
MIVENLPSIWENKPAPPPQSSYTYPPKGSVWDYRSGKWVMPHEASKTPSLALSSDKTQGSDNTVGTGIDTYAVGYQNLTKTIIEYNRKIENELRSINYNVGDLVVPLSAEGKKKYGQMRVLFIARNITEMNHSLPLDHDKEQAPMCVLLECVSNQSRVRCSPTYVTKVN